MSGKARFRVVIEVAAQHQKVRTDLGDARGGSSSCERSSLTPLSAIVDRVRTYPLTESPTVSGPTVWGFLLSRLRQDSRRSHR